MIEVQGLTKRYGPTTAIRDISFRVEKGDIVGFLGPNGAGKTTTMRILTGFLPPTEGTATVAGFDVMKEPLEVKRRMGYLPETPPVYPDMEVVEYLDFVARIKGLRGPEIAERIDYVVERVSIGHMREKLIGKLSKGYRQRVGIAQALIHDPDVLILDEPTSGLDPAQIIEVRELIRELAQEHTVILSTHILPEVATTCSRVIIIADGKIEANDTPENLTASIRGHGAVRLRIGGPVESVTVALEGIEGVESVEAAAAGEGPQRFTVRVDKSLDPRPAIARAVVEAGWDLHELQAVDVSLEDVFLRLTGADEDLTAVVAEVEAAEPNEAVEADKEPAAEEDKPSA